MDRAGLPGPLAKVMISATLFSFMHLVYQDATTLVLTFVIGLVWASAFYQTRNLAVVALSHAAIGPIAIYLGVM